LKPAVLVVIGASGAGKTAAVEALNSRRLVGVRSYFFDSIGVPTNAEMERKWGSGEGWQEAMTKQWLERLATNADNCEIAVLEGQTRPSFIKSHLARTGIHHAGIVLLDCAPAVRSARLRDLRRQPELANERMDAWAAYLRGQADALGLHVVDTSELSIEETADALQRELDALRRAATRSISPH
jgi:RNase adaptor protein for sRNA GlmZ degradation